MLNCNSVRLARRHIKVLLPGIKPVSAACWKQTNQLIQPDPSYTTHKKTTFATNWNKGRHQKKNPLNWSHLTQIKQLFLQQIKIREYWQDPYWGKTSFAIVIIYVIISHSLPAISFHLKFPLLLCWTVGLFLHDWRWVMSMSGSCQRRTNQVPQLTVFTRLVSHQFCC